MRRSVVALIALGLAVSATPVFAATASPMAACAAQWQAMKKAGTDKGTTYKDFSKACMSKGATTTVASTTTTTAPAAPPAKKPSAMTAKKTTTTTTSAPTPAAAPAAPAPAPVATKTTKTKTTKTTTKSAKAEDADPTGATANCKDGTYSHSKQHSGSCAGHGGVAKFLS
jgi:hypothetical protein